MDAWMDGWRDGWMHGWMDAWRPACMDGRMDPGFVNSPSRRYIFGVFFGGNGSGDMIINFNPSTKKNPSTLHLLGSSPRNKLMVPVNIPFPW